MQLSETFYNLQNKVLKYVGLALRSPATVHADIAANSVLFGAGKAQ